MHPSKHVLVFILVPLIGLSAIASYYRFIATNDYIVEYEGECDPATESCFEGCEDDACEVTYPYKMMHKYAADVRESCGPDITDCAEASVCLASDLECTVTYCNPEELGEDEVCLTPEEETEEEGLSEEITDDETL